MSTAHLELEPWLSAEEATQRIKNIFCVGRNYRDHATELGNDVPTEPLIFGKSTHTLTPATGVLEIPQGRTNVHHEVELVLHIGQDYHSGIQVSEIVTSIGLGLDLTDRDAQNRLKKAGQPWEYAKGFRNAAVITGLYHYSTVDDLVNSTFSLLIDGREVQSGSPRQMIFDLQRLIDFVGVHFGLKANDILFTGTPAGVGPLANGQHLELVLNGSILGEVKVQMD